MEELESKFYLASEYSENGKYQKAIELLDELTMELKEIRREESDYRKFLLEIEIDRGILYEKQNLYDKAIDAFINANGYHDDMIISTPDNLGLVYDKILTIKSLALVYMESNQCKQAHRTLLKAINICFTLLNKKYSKVHIIHELANIYSSQAHLYLRYGEEQKAIDKYYKSIESYNLVLEEKSEHIESLNNIASTKIDLANIYADDYSNQVEGITLLKEGIENYKKVLKLEPENSFSLHQMGLSFANLSRIHQELGQNSLALMAINESIESYHQVLTNFLYEINILNDFAIAQTQYLKFHKSESALAPILETISTLDLLISNNEESIKPRIILSNIKLNLGEFFEETGKLDTAIEYFKGAIEIIDIDTDNIEVYRAKAFAIASLGKTYNEKGKLEEALRFLNIASDNYYSILALEKGSMFVYNQLAWIGRVRAEIYYKQDKKEQSVNAFEKTIDLCNEALEINPNHIDLLINRADGKGDLYYLFQEEKSIEELYEIVKEYEHILEINSNNYDALNNKATTLSDIAEIYYYDKDFDNSIAVIEQELEINSKLIDLYPNDFTALFNQSNTKFNLGEQYLQKGDKSSAYSILKESVEDNDLAYKINPVSIDTLIVRSYALSSLVSIKIEEEYRDDSYKTNYALLKLYDEYFFDIEDEEDTFTLTEKMIYPLATILYTSYLSKKIDAELILQAIELSKSKTLKQIFSIKNLIDDSVSDSEIRDKVLEISEKIQIVQEEIREIYIEVEGLEGEIDYCLKSGLKKEMKSLKRVHKEYIKKQSGLYKQLKIYNTKLSEFLTIQDFDEDNIYNNILDTLDEESVVLYPLHYVTKNELSVVAVTKKDNKLIVNVEYEKLNESIEFSDYIYFIREVEELFSLIEREDSDAIQEKIEMLNESYLTVDNEIIENLFVVDKDMSILSLKMSQHEFSKKYKYIIIQKALSFIADICIRSIPKGMKKIYFSAFGDLNLLPLHAIATREGSYLIKEYEIVYIPFLSILDNLKTDEHMNKNLFISIDEHSDNLHDEAVVCHKIMQGEHNSENINTKEFKKLVHNQKYNLLHLSTHGISDLSNPLNSYLRFKKSQLSLLEIHGLKLDINLVVLSACETNLSKLKGADEVLAFERAFLIAGARNIITTFLTVDIDRSREFMEVFYINMDKKKSISSTFQQTCIEDIRANSSEWMLFRFTGV